MNEIPAKIVDALARINSGGQYDVLGELYYPDDAWHPLALFGLSAAYYFDAERGFDRRSAVIRQAAAAFSQEWGRAVLIARDEDYEVGSPREIEVLLTDLMRPTEPLDLVGTTGFSLLQEPESPVGYPLPCYRSVEAVVQCDLPDLKTSVLVETDAFAPESDRLSAHVARFVAGCRALSPFFAASGLAPLLPSDATSSTEKIFPLLKRFPGLGYEAPNKFSIQLGGRTDFVRDANWLTGINAAMVERIGGLKAVESALPPDVTVHPHEGGIVLQAGPAPKLGDGNSGDRPEAYRAVARLLKPLQFEEWTAPYFPAPPPLDGVEETRAWISRWD